MNLFHAKTRAFLMPYSRQDATGTCMEDLSHNECCGSLQLSSQASGIAPGLQFIL